MHARNEKGYLGVSSCVLFAIATAIVLTVVVLSNFDTDKMAGLESALQLTVLGPVVLGVYLAGIGFAIVGLQKPVKDRLSRVGLFLNLLPALLVLLLLVYDFVQSAL